MSTASERVTVSQRGNGLVARLNSPQLNEPTVAQEMSEQLESALETCPDTIESVRLELGEVQSIASLGLNHLIGFHSKASGQGLHVEISDLQPAVREVLEITRLDRVFRLTAQ